MGKKKNLKHINKSLNDADEAMDARLFFKKVLNNWWIFAVSIAICFAAAQLYLNYITPLYSIQAKLLVEGESKVGRKVAESDMLDLNSLFHIQKNIHNEVEKLKTKSLMEMVVRDLDLNINYFREGALKNEELYKPPFKIILDESEPIAGTTSYALSIKANKKGVLTYEQQGKEIKQELMLGTPVSVNGIDRLLIQPEAVTAASLTGEYSFTLTSVDETAAALRDKITITNPGEATTLLVSLSYPVPQKGEEILRTLINRYIKVNSTNKNLIADSTIAFIDNRLALVGTELGSVEGNIQNFMQGNKLVNLTEQSKQLIANSHDLVNQQATLETQVSIFRALEDYLRDESMNKRVVPGSVIPSGPVFTDLVSQYNNLLLERDRQLITKTEQNLFVQNIDQQLKKLRADILADLSNAKRATVLSINRLKGSTNTLDSKIKGIPAQERQYLDMARQQQIKQQLYLYLLEKREETAISKTSNISNVSIIDAPKSDIEPYSPKSSFVYLSALLIGLAIPLGGIFTLALFNKTVQTSKDVQKRTSLPIVAEITHHNSPLKLAVSAESQTIISDQFRALRTNLGFYLNTGNTILITSSMAGEGKSFIALNTAIALAISGKKVLLMELDLRNPTLSESIGISPEAGFTDYINAEAMDYAEVISDSLVHENLFILGAGTLPKNPSEILLDAKVPLLLEALKNEFDYVIIDSTPIGLVSDAQQLSEYADLTLFVIRERYTFNSQLLIPEELYHNKKMKRMGLVLNDVISSEKHTYYTKQKKNKKLLVFDN